LSRISGVPTISIRVDAARAKEISRSSAREIVWKMVRSSW